MTELEELKAAWDDAEVAEVAARAAAKGALEAAGDAWYAYNAKQESGK